jgi:hypothetical protein
MDRGRTPGALMLRALTGETSAALPEMPWPKLGTRASTLS